MKIRKQTTSLVEIGPLDDVVWLPTAKRKRHYLGTVCCRCGCSVDGDYFALGFKAGQPNMILHEECIDPEDRHLIDAAKAKAGGAP